MAGSWVLAVTRSLSDPKVVPKHLTTLAEGNISNFVKIQCITLKGMVISILSNLNAVVTS